MILPGVAVGSGVLVAVGGTGVAVGGTGVAVLVAVSVGTAVATAAQRVKVLRPLPLGLLVPVTEALPIL